MSTFLVVFIAKTVATLLDAEIAPTNPCPICGLPVLVCPHSVLEVCDEYSDMEDDWDNWFDGPEFDPAYELALGALDRDEAILDMEAEQHSEETPHIRFRSNKAIGLARNVNSKSRRFAKHRTARINRRNARRCPEFGLTGYAGRES